MRRQTSSSGFTIIELLVVVVFIGILLTLVASTYSGVQAKNRNNRRQTAIDTLQSQLETYYVQYSRYPTVANLNDSTWRQANMKNVSDSSLTDPHWSIKTTACTASNKATVINKPTTNCYSYQPVGPDGSACNDTTVMCAQYTLTALLEGGGKYVKSSLN